jgi:hypothetical protein
MKYNPVFRLGTAVLAAGFLLAGSAPGGEAAKPASGGLVRMDLLSKGAAEIVPPRRDIFRAKPAFAQPGFAAAQAVSETSVPAPPEPEPEPEATVSEPSLDLTYVGYISSPHRTVALVIIQGQAQAVAEGEEILPGVKIEKVSRDKISLVGPGSKRTVVPLQGEES